MKRLSESPDLKLTAEKISEAICGKMIDKFYCDHDMGRY
jgi:hypothetical protein